MTARRVAVALVLLALLVAARGLDRHTTWYLASDQFAFLTQADEHLNNPVGAIGSGTFPWTVRSGHARVNLSTGAVSFEVHGLVIVGNTFSGTPGPITAVVGTLVCNPGVTQTTFDTPDVSISGEGDARFSGTLQNVPATCPSPLFLVRIASLNLPGVDPDAADGLWIATGAEREINN